MHADLERLVELQRIDSTIEAARRAIDQLPDRRAAIDAGLAAQTATLESAKTRAAENATARRDLEKELATVQTRLRRYKDQLMEVKTNKEYLAMQHEIASAEQEVARFEDRLLERLVEADELGAAIKATEVEVVAGKAESVREHAALDVEVARWEASIAEHTGRRQTVAAEVSAQALALFEYVKSRRGTAVVEARDGHCSVCHVRLRPHLYNQIRLNESILQCESCQRILFFAPAGPSPSAP